MSSRKCKKPDRVQLIEILGLKKSSTINEVISFLLHPVDSGKHVTNTRDKSRTPRRASSLKNVTPKKSTKQLEDADLSMSESEEDSSNESDGYIPSRPAKKARTTKTPKKVQKKAVKKTPTRSPPKRAATKKAKKYTEDDESEEMDDLEEEVRKIEESESDKELEKTVKEVVGSIDLEEVSMNDAIKKVYEKYPDQDISGKKDKIKNWIRDMI